MSDMVQYRAAKDQIKSEWMYEIINFQKKWTKEFEGFLPWST